MIKFWSRRMELITKLDDKKLFPNTPICEQRITTMPSYPE